MAKGQGEGQKGAEFSSGPRRGVDPLALVTLIGVVALLMITFANWRDVARIDRSLGERLSRLEARIDRVADNLNKAPAQAAQPRRGPDPNRVYTIDTDGAPFRGKASAPVTIVEFSDFQ